MADRPGCQKGLLAVSPAAPHARRRFRGSGAARPGKLIGIALEARDALAAIERKARGLGVELRQNGLELVDGAAPAAAGIAATYSGICEDSMARNRPTTAANRLASINTPAALTGATYIGIAPAKTKMSGRGCILRQQGPGP